MINDVDDSYKITIEKQFHDDPERRARQPIVSLTEGIAEDATKFWNERLVSIFSKHKYVLEYGCGDNLMATTFIWLGAEHVIGIDISEGIVQRSRTALSKLHNISSNVEYLMMNAEQLSFPDETFDAVVGMAILHHLDLEQAYREIVRVLKPGGVALFWEPLGHNPFINWFRNKTPDARTPTEHPLLLTDIQMAKKYFSVTKTSEFVFSALFLLPLRKFLPKRLFQQLVNIASKIDRILLKLFPFLRKHCWIIIMEFVKA